MQSTFRNEIIQDETQFLVEGSDSSQGYLLSLDPVSGAVRWSKDAFDDAGQCKGPGSLAESNQGQILVTLGCPALSLAALDRQGNLKWLRTAPFEEGIGPAIDSNGNASFLGTSSDVCDGGVLRAPLLWTVSPGGETLLEEPIPVASATCDCVNLSVFQGAIATGTGVVVAEPSYYDFVSFDGGSFQGLHAFGSIIALDGGVTSLPTLSVLLTNGQPIMTPVIDAAGESFVPGILGIDGRGGISAIEPTGEVRWSSSALMGGSLALSDDGVVFGLQAFGAFEAPVSVVALDTDAGTLDWSIVIPQPYLPASSDGLALTPGASLLTFSKTGAMAIFAGKHRPSTTAPWPRWGGDNSNRSSAR